MNISVKKRCCHVWVAGRVQGVWFRARTCDQAQKLGLDGWVRNLSDGRVEVLVQGSDAGVSRLLEWLETGPPLARVDQLEISDGVVQEGVEGFAIV